MPKYLSILFLFISLNGFCQSLSERQPEVFTQVNRVDNLKNLDSVSFENEEFLEQTTDGGGELIGYYSNDTLVKIIAYVGLSFGIETNEYYFDSDHLFFVRETFASFEYVDSLATFNFETTEVNFVGEYIFKNNQIIDLESLGHYKFEDDEIDIEETTLSEVMKYKSLLQEQTYHKTE